MAFDLIGANCQHAKTSVVNCIEEKTFRRTDVFKDVILGFTAKKSVLNKENLFTEDFTTDWDGIFYAIDVQKRIGPDDSTDQFYILLNKSLIYNIFIHDPNYFIVNENPAGLPSIMLKFNPNNSGGNYYYRISLTEVEELDLPEDPCNADPDYNFQACVKQSLSSQVGCRTKWDTWSQTGMELCNQLDQFRYNLKCMVS